MPVNCGSCGVEFVYPKVKIYGDIFFTYCCASCSPAGSQRVAREPITWPIIIHLTLYSLHQVNPERRFFKMKEDICAFLLEHWNWLIPHKDRQSTWENTVSSALSTHPELFHSGLEEMKQVGWWRLRDTENVPTVPEKSDRPYKKRASRKKFAAQEEFLDPLERQPHSEPVPVHEKKLSDKHRARMSASQENFLLASVQKVADDPRTARLRQKLRFRALRRIRKEPQFDLDEKIHAYLATARYVEPFLLPELICKPTESLPVCTDSSLLFATQLHGGATEPAATTLYHQDWAALPPKLAILRIVGGQLHPINYGPITEANLPLVNQLLSEFFWPGIDVSEQLSQPLRSVVVCYRRLVVGCALLATDSMYLTYLLVHPDWQGAGLATQMLNLLLTNCPNGDVTLHVSATNSAMLLYQKFCFKPEQFAVNFYHRYLQRQQQSSDLSIGTLSAFFMRLRR